MEANTPEQKLLTLREMFAMAAMQGILSNSRGEYYDGNTPGCYVPSVVAKDAVEHADALIAELKKRDNG